MSTKTAIVDRLDHISDQVDSLTTVVTRVADNQYLNGVPGVLDHVETDADRLGIVADAIDTESVLTFRYVKCDGTHTLRTVSPYTIREAQDGQRFLIGYDHVREGLRQFALTRVAEVEDRPEFDFVGE